MKNVFVVWMALSSILGWAQVPTYVPTDGLVAWYPLNGNASDVSGNGHHGTMEGASPAPDRYHAVDECLVFDGVNDGVFISHDPDFLTIDQTITFWMHVGPSQLEDSPGLMNSMGLINKTKQDSPNYENRFFALNLGGAGEPTVEPFKVTLAGSTGCTPDPGSNVESTSTDSLIHAQQWYFVVAVMTDNVLQIFIDGELVSSNVLSCQRIENEADIKIGVDYTFHPNRFFNGLMDDVGFWNRALEAQEILDLFLASAPVDGCTDELACNYNPEANVNDDSCYSCDIPAAHCGEGTFWDDESQSCVIANPSDTDFDGCVGMTDLLDLLSAFGTCNEIPWSCGDPLEYQGYDYSTVQIGEQCWFAENLRAENYSSEEPIQSGLTDAEWTSTEWGAIATYGEGVSGCSHVSPAVDACDESLAFEEYGLLYNWFAVDDQRGVCPSGWHVPLLEEFQSLSSAAGGDALAGLALKASSGWTGDGHGTNESGFGGLAGGFRHQQAQFENAGYDGIWWMNYDAGESAKYLGVVAGSSAVYYETFDKNYGFSIRCLQDSE